jgi:hypothetical protein
VRGNGARVKPFIEQITQGQLPRRQKQLIGRLKPMSTKPLQSRALGVLGIRQSIADFVLKNFTVATVLRSVMSEILFEPEYQDIKMLVECRATGTRPSIPRRPPTSLSMRARVCVLIKRALRPAA